MNQIRLRRYTPEELRYSATARCHCGAGLAYPDTQRCPEGEPRPTMWVCARVLLAEAPADEPLAVADFAQPPDPRGVHVAYPFWCFEIKSECQPSALGSTTRPETQGRVHVYEHVLCKACGHEWDTALHPPNDSRPMAERFPDCPACGEYGYRLECGNNGTTRESRTRCVLVKPSAPSPD